ncbi:MAG TPA: TonB-dependent receptor [Syntrophorhabdaceae bacterium]|nr:TonB-dependent receptor [Syntrophorhabdaceae bacterium]
MYRTFLFTITVLFFIVSVSLHASEPVLYELEGVVVTATRTEEMRKDIPNAVIVLDEKDIQASGTKSVGELIGNELGVDWQTYGNYGGASQDIHIRGMRANATQIMVNGVNVVSPSLGIADIGKIPIENIERIEIVKGSGSLLYGSGAMAGTINIITKSPKREKPDLRISSGYGTQNTYRIAAENGMFIGRDIGYYLTAGRTKTDGFRDNSYLKQNDVSAKVLWDKNEFINVTLYGDYIYRKYGVPGVVPPPGTGDYYRNGVKFYNDESATLLDHSSDKDGHAVLEIKGEPFKWLGYNVRGHYTGMENYNYSRYAYDGSGAENWVGNRIAGVDGHVNFYPFEGARLLLGGEYKDFDWKNRGYNLNTDGSRIGPESVSKAHMFTRSLFTEAEYRPSKYWKALAGVRHEYHSAYGGIFLPLFGVVINPHETTALKFSHGRHFVAPTPNDLYWPADLFTRGNPNLKPEIGWHTDATIEQSLFKDKLFMTLSYFHWNVDDKIQWEPDSQGVFTPINLGGYKADGMEAGVRIGPFYDMTLALNYTYTDAREKNREYTRQDYGWFPILPPDFQYSMVTRRASYTPRNQFRADLTYRADFGLTVAATARYVGNRVIYLTETTVYPETKTVAYNLHSYWTADLKLEQRLYKHWIVSVSGTNLFDKKYDTRLARFTDQDLGITSTAVYPGAGRSVFAGLTYEF